MKNVVDGLYTKYNDELKPRLEDDDFYQYFYNLLETGTTLCNFYNRKLLKEVDEDWVSQIEEALPHIQRVVENPRKFIEENRQIVNVAQAKKFTSESVKHLSQHSELVSKIYDDGTIEPNKVLNVFKEESLNTYENRFINTLILELKDFIDERFKRIFDDSRDEDGVKLDLESMIDNYSEVVQYKLELRIREKQLDTANDDDNVNIFTRITKIHKGIQDLSNTGFCLQVSKFPRVKHPIVKTNAIGKHPDYKACYNLWNFIHSYERAGYRLQILEQDPVVSRSFEKSLYNQIIMDYVVVREHMEYMDLLNINKPKRSKQMGINSIRQFVRDLVEEYEISASDLRKLVESELNEALKLKEEKERMQEELLKRKKGLANIEGQVQGWEGFGEGEEKKEDVDAKVKERMSKKQRSRLRKQIKAQREQVLREEKKKLADEKKALLAQGRIAEDELEEFENGAMNDEEIDAIEDEILDVMYEFVDLEKLVNGGIRFTGYGNEFINEEVLMDARFSRLVRKMDKARLKRDIKYEKIKQRSEIISKDDAGKASKILNKAEEERLNKVRKNEQARKREIAKAKKEQELAKQKAIKEKLRIQSKEEKKRLKLENKEKAAILRKEEKAAREIRRQQQLLDKEREREAKELKRIEDKKNRIEARKQAALNREAMRLQKKEIRAQNRIRKAELRQLRKADAKLARQRRINELKQRRENAKLRREQERNLRVQNRLDAKASREKSRYDNKQYRLKKAQDNRLYREKRRAQRTQMLEARKQERFDRQVENARRRRMMQDQKRELKKKKREQKLRNRKK